MNMKTIAVLSGGMDSTTALAWALNNGHDVIGAINFQYGSKHNEKERKAAKHIADHYKVKLTYCDLDFMRKFFKSDLLVSGEEIPDGHYADESMKKTVVPFRNGIMIALAAGFAESEGAEGVILGNHFGDHAIYPDCREDFSEAMRKAVELGTYARIRLLTPFVRLGKHDIAYLGSRFKVPYDLTYSCYKGGEKHCGKCGTCVERKEAFHLCGVKDPTEYEK